MCVWGSTKERSVKRDKKTNAGRKADLPEER